MIPYFSFDKIKIGPITLYVWGIFLALAFLVAFFWVLKKAKKQKIDPDIINNSFSWIILGTIVGARLGYVLQFPKDYFSQPLEILKIWEGGLTFHGGLFGMLIAALIYAKFAKISRRLFFQIADLVVLVAPISIAIGRIGCSLVNDHQGAITSLPWGIIWPDGIVRHPVAEYLIISNLIIFFVLRFLKSRLKELGPVRDKTPEASAVSTARISNGAGQLFFAFLLLYSISRFFLDFTRSTDTLLSDPRYFILSTAQWLSLAVIIGIMIKKLIKLNTQSNNVKGNLTG